MPKIKLNLGDIIAAYFGVPGPSMIKNAGSNYVSGVLDSVLADAQKKNAPYDPVKATQEMFPDITESQGVPALSAANTPPDALQSLTTPTGGNNTLFDVFSLLRNFNKMKQ